MNWYDEAKRLFFCENKKILEIAETVGKTRKTVSAFLSSQPGFDDEKKRRKAEKKQKRKQYQKSWEKNRKRGSGIVEAALLKRQHEIDVRVLSSEKY